MKDIGERIWQKAMLLSRRQATSDEIIGFCIHIVDYAFVRLPDVDHGQRVWVDDMHSTGVIGGANIVAAPSHQAVSIFGRQLLRSALGKQSPWRLYRLCYFPLFNINLEHCALSSGDKQFMGSF